MFHSLYSAIQKNVVQGCVSMVLVHATFDRVYLDCRVYHSLTVDLDGELRLDLAPDVAGLAAVDALVLVAPQVRDDERRLHPVAVLAVRRQEDVAVLQISFHQLVPDRT